MEQEPARSLIKLTKISPRAYGIVVNDRLSDIVEALVKDGHFELYIRGDKDSFGKIPVTEPEEMENILYLTADQIIRENPDYSYSTVVYSNPSF